MEKILQPSYFENLETGKNTNLLIDRECWYQYKLNISQITGQSRVLAIGCGQDETVIWLAQQTGCEVIGIDDQTVNFSQFPFPDQSFTHVWSQTALYQIQEHQQILTEIERILQADGILMLDDLVMPMAQVNKLREEWVDQFLSIKSLLTSKEYAESLNRMGLMVLDSLDLTAHLRKSYELQLDRHQAYGSDSNRELIAFFKQAFAAIDAGKLGWWFYYCKKVSDRLQWIHNNKNTDELRRKYDAWAALYENDLAHSWLMPVHAARLLAQLQANQEIGQGSSKEIAILDAGAGTGKVGQALSQLGYSNITAIDLSIGMLEEARKKQVYHALHAANLEEPLTFCKPGTFDVITAIGVFTYGHVSPAGLYHLLPLLKPGGVFLITVRASNQLMQDAFKDFPWSLVKQEDYEFETAPFYLLVYRKH